MRAPGMGIAQSDDRANRWALETPETRNVAPASRLSKPLSETDMSLLDTFHTRDDSPVCHLTLFRGFLRSATGMRPWAYVYMRSRLPIEHTPAAQQASALLARFTTVPGSSRHSPRIPSL